MEGSRTNLVATGNDGVVGVDSRFVSGMLYRMTEIDLNNLPNDVEALRVLLLASHKEREESVAKIDQLEAEKKSLTQLSVAKIAELSQQIANLQEQLLAFRHARFGKSSEKLDAQIHQMELMLEDLESTVGEQNDDREKKPQPLTPTQPRGRQALPEDLPRETQQHGVCSHCEHCGDDLTLIGEDISEQLEYVPASFRVIRHRRPKYRCDSCDTLVQASAPSKPIPKSYAGPSLLAHVAVAKFCDHLPLYRQSVIYAREGVDLPRSTLADWIGKVCSLLRPLDNALCRYVMDSEKIHGDDTPVPVLQPGRKTTKQGRLWGYLKDNRPAGDTAAPAVWFSYSPDRKGLWPQKHLANYQGTLQADGYAGYNALYDTGRIKEAACWAHVRRKFFEIDKAQPNSFATEVLQRIGELYFIEKEIRGKTPQQRQDIRRARAGPKLEDLQQRLRSTLSQISRKSNLAKSIHYALARWDALVRYVDDGLLEIDNNPIERQIRPIALGRKNYLFAGSDAGGNRAAMMYSLLNTARLNGIDPEAYLAKVLATIADHPVNCVDELLPWNIEMGRLVKD